MFCTMLAALLVAFAGCRSHRPAQGSVVDDVMVGAYTEHRAATDREVALFHQACAAFGLQGLTPQSVATQVVAGTNYLFLCADRNQRRVSVTIFEPLPGQGRAEVTEVQVPSRTVRKATAVVVVYYDPEIGPAPLEETIRREECEVVYRYSNFNAYALRLKNEKTRKALEETRGVLSVVDNQIMQLHETD